MNLILDVSNLCHTSLHSGKDREAGVTVQFDGKPVFINSAQHGFDAALDFLVPVMKELNFVPRDLIFVEEEKGSREFRALMYPDYKHALTGKGKPDEAYEQFNIMKTMLRSAFLPLGSRFVSQAGVEADDVIAYLAEKLPASIIISTDVDLQACISDKCSVWHKGIFNENRLGPFPVQYTRLYKSLVGDSGDAIKGAKGFGDRAFLDLYAMFGDEGCDALIDLIQSRKLEKLSEDVGSLKSLQRIIDDRQSVYLSEGLAKLYVERVNTMRRPLVWTLRPQQLGLVTWHDARLDQWAPKQKLVHAGNYAATLEWFRSVAAVSPFIAFDIETTTPAESDEWLANRSKKANGEDGARTGVDVLASTLVGQSFTLGANGEFTLYCAVDHDGSDGLGNITKEQAAEFIKAIPQSTVIVVQNASFELSVLEREWRQYLGDNGWHGFLPNVHDTKLMASHVDENSSNGLKSMSKSVLGYDQVSYKEVCTIEEVERKMNQLSAKHVFNYGADDAICTSALYNHFRTIMLMEGSWAAYLQVDVLPAYLTALAFNQGTPVSMQALLAQEKDDQAIRAEAWSAVRQFLIDKGWEGTVPPTCGIEITAAEIKEAYLIVTGEKLETMVRTPAKLAAMIAATGKADLLASLIGADPKTLTEYVQSFFKGEPTLNFGSPKQLQNLLYGDSGLGLEVRVHNKPTDAMRAAGLREGSPSTDALAISYALHFDAPEGSDKRKIIQALQAIKSADTKQGLFYSPYRGALHWQTGLIHSSMNQCATNTRRYTSSGPNLQQLPANTKVGGEPPKFREIFLGHKSNAVVVSMDFSGQELRLIADDAQDKNMLACYVGDNLLDLHSLTAVGILNKKNYKSLLQISGLADAPGLSERWHTMAYPEFAAVLAGAPTPEQALFKRLRATAKTVNFAEAYGAMAKKLGHTLMVDKNEAQQYLDAKLEAFPRVTEWKREVEQEASTTGLVRSRMGAVRHLGPALLSRNSFESTKALRQAVNYRIQGSAAEMTKLAMCRVWESDLLYRYDARFIAPVHDELVMSVVAHQAADFIAELHAMMVQPFADMAVPVVSSISLGRNFGEQHEIGETVDKVKIEQVLCDIGFMEPERLAA